ncbi:ADP-ribosylglycohydrolase [Streptomyces aidingensis]|uniref:ADP-ribosylglycohydrolase n=1 Tax=Streptomyces aidingensis TaxID=910347 RepID=A0A1I1PB86_9ACTN|nr:ADP-ribosylglycohydrolase family protein [Streptomyces aidingensis]SFD06976.1 ADP-ribosylglycohydrolase [Streptomyces aidingensis]
MANAAQRTAATGSLFGLALGDALGWPTEFKDTEAIAALGPWRELPLPDPAVVTDDTQMTLAVGRALQAATGHSGGTGDAGDAGSLTPEGLERALREEFVAWYHSPENNRAPGHTCLAACRLLDGDRPWQQATGAGSKGCGANMRVAPLGLMPGLTDEERAGAAQLQAGMTHGHPTALAASDLTAHAVRLLAEGCPPGGLPAALRAYAGDNRTVYHERWLGGLWQRPALGATPEEFIASGWDECLAALDRLEAALPGFGPDSDPCAATGDGWIAEEALATALLCFLRFPDEPVTAIRRGAATRGDSDSIAAIAGALAGARLGIAAWPTAWCDRVEYRTGLLRLGTAWDTGR